MQFIVLVGVDKKMIVKPVMGGEHNFEMLRQRLSVGQIASHSTLGVLLTPGRLYLGHHATGCPQLRGSIFSNLRNK